MEPKKKHILLVEDQESLRLLMSNFLSKDYVVVAKNDGLDAYAWLSEGNIPHLIILDMSLPTLSGFEFLTNIRSSGLLADIPVIIVSGNDDHVFQDKCYELGIIDYLTKPFNPLELQTKINITLNQKQRSSY